jgi:hypothetical protein
MRAAVLIVAVGWLLAVAASAHVSAAESPHFKSATPIGLEPELRLPHNTPERLRSKPMDPDTVRLISESAGPSAKESAAFQIAPDPAGPGLWLSLPEEDGQKAYSRFARRLQLYLWGRSEGHTRECLLAGLRASRLVTAGVTGPTS